MLLVAPHTLRHGQHFLDNRTWEAPLWCIEQGLAFDVAHGGVGERRNAIDFFHSQQNHLNTLSRKKGTLDLLGLSMASAY